MPLASSGMGPQWNHHLECSTTVNWRMYRNNGEDRVFPLWRATFEGLNAEDTLSSPSRPSKVVIGGEAVKATRMSED